MKVPFNDLSRSLIGIEDEVQAALTRVVTSGWFVLGPEHNALETELAEFVGVRNAVNVANGTDALELALAALGVNAGDQVVTVANAGAYATTAIRLLGAVPVYCDIDPSTLLMSAQTVTDALASLDSAPKAIVVTHLYGAVAPMKEIVAIAREHGIYVLEDCAQSLGASIDGQQSGSFGDIATTSFYPTKNLGALGDAGAVFTNDDGLADAVRRMRQYGWSSKYHIEYAHGRNSRLDELQAAVLRVKLPRLAAQNDVRRQIHAHYETVMTDSVQLVNVANESFIAHLAVITAGDRASAKEVFSKAGVQTDVHYPVPDYRQKFPDVSSPSKPLEVTEWASESVLSLPLFPGMTEVEIDLVAKTLGGL